MSDICLKRTFRFRLYPSKKQRLKLNNQMELAKRLYNHLLGKAIERYKKEGKMFTKFDMNNYIARVKKQHLEYQRIHSQVLQNISDRLSKAFSNFFKRIRRKKSGDKIKAGFPRFKRYVKSITYP